MPDGDLSINRNDDANLFILGTVFITTATLVGATPNTTKSATNTPA